MIGNEKILTQDRRIRSVRLKIEICLVSQKEKAIEESQALPLLINPIVLNRSPK